MGENSNDNQPEEQPDDDKIVSISDKDYYGFMQSLDKLEEVKKNLLLSLSAG